LANPNRYAQIVERIFLARYQPGIREITFERDEFARVAEELGILLPKNLGDVVYSFRYRVALPDTIRNTAGDGEAWIIRPAGRGRYCLVLTQEVSITPNRILAETKIPDATPGIVTRYALTYEQGLLARLRYNRLIDIFTGVTCYSLQNHLRTTVPDIGQIEIDEVYVGVDRRGAHYVFPVQAKGGRDRLSIVQIEQDFALCKHKFPGLICRPIAAQFIEGELIALFDFEDSDKGLVVATERHYRLVLPDKVSDDELNTYRLRSQ
jgi:hypothetical protein